MWPFPLFGTAQWKPIKAMLNSLAKRQSPFCVVSPNGPAAIKLDTVTNAEKKRKTWNIWMKTHIYIYILEMKTRQRRALKKRSQVRVELNGSAFTKWKTNNCRTGITITSLARAAFGRSPRINAYFTNKGSLQPPAYGLWLQQNEVQTNYTNVFRKHIKNVITSEYNTINMKTHQNRLKHDLSITCSVQRQAKSWTVEATLIGNEMPRVQQGWPSAASPPRDQCSLVQPVRLSAPGWAQKIQ